MAAWTQAAARAAGYVITLGLAGLMAACGGGAEQTDPVAKTTTTSTTPDTTPNTATVATSSPLVRAPLPVGQWLGEDGQHVVRNSSDWERVWTAVNGMWPTPPAPPLTHIDFKQHMLVGVTSSYSGCSGQIEIGSVTQETTPLGDEWVVHFQRQDQGGGPGMVCTDDMKPVADFILWPQSPLPVRFVELPRRH